MAKKLSAETANEEPTELVNVEARREAIRKAFAEICSTERQLAALTEKYLTPLRDQRTKLWRDVKADTNIPRKVLSAEYALYKLAREANDFMDEDEGASRLDDLREAHLALHPGETLDWAAALNWDEQAKKPKGNGAAGNDPAGEAIYIGAQAALDGQPRTANPHAEGSDAHDAWEKGWHNGEKQRAIRDGKKKPAAAEAAAVH